MAALQKQNLSIPFGQGIDTKTDPKQVPPGKFLELNNGIFTSGNLLQKRNGFGQLTALTNSATNLSTFNDNLLAIGTNLQSLSADTNQWIQKGTLHPVSLNTQALVRTDESQTSVDIAVHSNGICCAVFLNSGGTASYQISDSTTGQSLTSVVDLPSGAALPRVFLLGNYFVITFLIDISATTHMRRISIPVSNPGNPSSATDISTTVDSISGDYNGYIASNGNLYIAYNASNVGGAVKIVYLDPNLNQSNTVTFASQNANLMSVTDDAVNETIWASYWDSAATTIKTIAVDYDLLTILSSTIVKTSVTLAALTSTAVNGTVTIFYDEDADYSYVSTRTDRISSITVTEGGIVGSPTIILRSVGLASKAVYYSSTNTSYMLTVYGGSEQPTYFLIDNTGNVIAKLAYSNANGYPATKVLPTLNLIDSTLSVGYLKKTQLFPVNKTQGAVTTAAIYAQTGVNIAFFIISDVSTITSEIGNNLHLTGGFMWMYDGIKPVEHSFHLYPEDILATPSGTGGSMSAQLYNYQITYEWTDGQGNIHRSAPSIPIDATTSTGTSSVTLDIPTLRLTYKSAPNDIRIVIYRWSTAQQTFYQITSITSPLLNDSTVDSVQYVDTVADASILGNLILYTTGGVVENIAAPACNTMTLYKSRLVLIDAEDPNLLWFSKQVIQNTPVEMSDLFTFFVAPTISAQGSTGPNKAIAALDDKLVVFKKNAIYYIVGNGPDNTGNNNDFSEPIFITSTIGCSNQNSIVFIPSGLVFQSDKGWWLLGRDLSTKYIGAPVEAYNNNTTLSAINVPGTNQIRFTLDNDITLMYDYYYDQWATFTGIPATSSTVYQGLHTFVNDNEEVFQETIGSYLDGSHPVLLSFKSAWFSLAGLQGFQRAYFFFMLGQYFSPHKLNVGISYDYDPSIEQTSIISPVNFSPAWGGDALWGSSSPWGGPSNIEQWRVFLARQKCQSFQITISEQYDSSFDVEAGYGLTISGLNLVIGVKSGYARLKPSLSVG